MTDDSIATEADESGNALSRSREDERKDDLRRSREYSDSFRKYLAAAITGAIGLLFAIAGSLLDNFVTPKWIVAPMWLFVSALVAVGIALLFGEHRSLLRRKDPKAQQKLPWWKKGITWNLVPLGLFIIGICLSVSALNDIKIPPPKQECAPAGEAPRVSTSADTAAAQVSPTEVVKKSEPAKSATAEAPKAAIPDVRKAATPSDKK